MDRAMRRPNPRFFKSNVRFGGAANSQRQSGFVEDFANPATGENLQLDHASPGEMRA